MLIIEGPDGAGKTTLVRQLSESTGWPIMPRVVNENTTITQGTSLKIWVEQNIRGGFQKQIFDRHRLISEPIYGPLFRDCLQDGFDDDQWFFKCWSIFCQLRPIVIYCLPPLEVVRQNIINDPHNIIVREHIDLVYWQYWSMYARNAPRSYRFDYTNPNNWTPSQLMGLVRQHMRGLR